MSWIAASAAAAALAFAAGPRPRLKADAPPSRVPLSQQPAHLESWLSASESSFEDLLPGAEARIDWADPEQPDSTELCFLYLHGFSASRRETSPVTERLAETFKANVVHARLAGHGLREGMLATAEDWLQSVVDAWHLAEQLGKRVVVVGTSTGATLSVWLAHQSFTQEKIHAFLFMSPNFKIRSPFGFLLTWPWSNHWIPLLLGNERRVDSQSGDEARIWTQRYPIQALVEMQKTVDWVRRADTTMLEIPLATMYMKNDNVVDARHAVRLHESWGARHKRLIPVIPDGDSAEHVFVGHATAPHRVDWCVERFEAFLRQL